MVTTRGVRMGMRVEYDPVADAVRPAEAGKHDNKTAAGCRSVTV